MMGDLDVKRGNPDEILFVEETCGMMVDVCNKHAYPVFTHDR